ncbi:putative movement protein 2 [Ginger chlorotic fleck-associated tombusvirus]|nr:putative movement protein 2 [Ginger chlorotic fleck-associated tombusvirus]
MACTCICPQPWAAVLQPALIVVLLALFLVLLSVYIAPAPSVTYYQNHNSSQTKYQTIGIGKDAA